MAHNHVTTIGLEIHVELHTATKMFCGCPVGFGGEPNSRVCPVCLGHPGTLPVPNERAIEFTEKIALALGCEVAPRSIFHRKNYFYPDMPKNYQISQYDIPVGSRGVVEVEVEGVIHRVGITRVHLEEDTGKSVHMGGKGRIHGADYSLEDFNRAGTPLVEIVTEPDITSAEVAKVFAQELRTILEFLEVSDVKMEEGSLRVDANVSVAPPGERGVKLEVKNMNSMKSLHRALLFEEARLQTALEAGEEIVQATRHWDEKAGVTRIGRTKEFSEDYRYFSEPDLCPIEPSVEWLRQLREELPESPAERRKRFTDEGLSTYDAGVLTSSKAVADFFERASGSSSAGAKPVANWIANDLMGLLSERSEDLSEASITPEALAALVDKVTDGALSKNQGKTALAEMLATGASVEAVIEKVGLAQVSDRGELEAAVDEALRTNPDIVERLKAGDRKPMGFLMGQIIKATKGKGNPAIINEILRERLG